MKAKITHAFKHAFSFKLKFIFNQKFHACIIQKRIKKSNFMHSYMHSSKIKQKKIEFHAFIYAFFKNNKIKENQISCIHICILQK